MCWLERSLLFSQIKSKNTLIHITLVEILYYSHVINADTKSIHTVTHNEMLDYT